MLQKMSKDDLTNREIELRNQFNAACQAGLKLDMTRGNHRPNSWISLTQCYRYPEMGYLQIRTAWTAGTMVALTDCRR